MGVSFQSFVIRIRLATTTFLQFLVAPAVEVEVGAVDDRAVRIRCDVPSPVASLMVLS